MAEVVPGTNYQRLQNFATNSPWSERAVMGQVAEEADQLLGGEPDSSLLIDESGFAKKGEDSVGVARQWCGRLGKVDNCQVGVFGVLCNGARYALIDARLYLPKEWISDPARCESAGIPAAEVVARSKSEHALAIVAQARAQGVRFNWVGVDAGYGKEPAFLRALDAAGEIFVADVHKLPTGLRPTPLHETIGAGLRRCILETPSAARSSLFGATEPVQKLDPGRLDHPHWCQGRQRPGARFLEFL